MLESNEVHRVLIRGGVVLAMGDAVGSVTAVPADVMVEDGVIVAIDDALYPEPGCDIVDAAGCVVMPGLIDTHRHLWSAAVRHTGVGWDYGKYHMTVQRAWGETFSAEDVYWSQTLGALSALDAGVTTICDDSHIQNSPAHTDAAISALQDAGIRARFGYGWPGIDVQAWMFNTKLLVPEDIRRVRNDVLADDDALVTLQATVRGPEVSGIDIAEHDLRVARELGLRASMHVGFGFVPGIEQLHSRGLLGPDVLLVHGSRSSDEELRAATGDGAFFSVSPGSEGYMPGLGVPPMGRLLTLGARPSVSADTEVAATADLFSSLRALFVTDTTARNVAPDEFGKRTVVTPTDLLHSATSWGSAAAGLGSTVGSLTVGRDADLILVRLDGIQMFPASDVPRSLVAAATAREVDTVMVRGRILKRAGVLADGRFDDVKAHIRGLIDRLSPRPGSGPADAEFVI